MKHVIISSQSKIPRFLCYLLRSYFFYSVLQKYTAVRRSYLYFIKNFLHSNTSWNLIAFVCTLTLTKDNSPFLLPSKSFQHTTILFSTSFSKTETKNYWVHMYKLKLPFRIYQLDRYLRNIQNFHFNYILHRLNGTKVRNPPALDQWRFASRFWGNLTLS